MSDIYKRYPVAPTTSLTPTATTGHLLAAAPNTYNIGGATSTDPNSTDYRYKHAFLEQSLIVGSFDGKPPYAGNNDFFTGVVGAGALSHTSALMGANGFFFNLTPMAFMVFSKDGGASNAPGFFNGNTALDLDVYFGIGHQASAREDLLKFGADGNLSLLKAGGNLLWGTDGGGQIGNTTDNRPSAIYADITIGIGDGNNDSATGLDMKGLWGGGTYLPTLQFWGNSPDTAIGWVSATRHNGDFGVLIGSQSNDQGGVNDAAWFQAGVSRIYGDLWVSGRIGVNNAAAATTPGTVVKKIEVFDSTGVSLGFIPVYDSIT